MSLDLWFREEVTRILASVLEVQRNNARSIAPLDTETAAAYQRGFVDALLAVAVAFGVRGPLAAPVAREVDPRVRGGDGSGWR
jgi:hypothetical protein